MPSPLAAAVCSSNCSIDHSSAYPPNLFPKNGATKTNTTFK